MVAPITSRAARFATQRSGVNVCFRVYPERLRPLPTISHEPQPRAVFQILLDGLFQQFGSLPSLGARSILPTVLPIRRKAAGWLSTWRLRYYCRTSANRLYHRSLGEMGAVVESGFASVGYSKVPHYPSFS